MKATILNEYEMDLTPPQEGDETWFLDWVLRAPKHAGDHLACSYKTFDAIASFYEEDILLGNITSVKEYFGGMGAHAMFAQDLFTPSDHAVSDYSRSAVQHMQEVLPGNVRVTQADAYDAETPWPADIVILDFGDLTVFKAQQDQPRGILLDKVFAMKPNAVTITDIAARYLHLQKRSYEPLLGEGCCESYEEYLERFSSLLQARYGYTMLQANYTRWSTVMAFVPAETGIDKGEFIKHTSSAPSLVIS